MACSVAGDVFVWGCGLTYQLANVPRDYTDSVYAEDPDDEARPYRISSKQLEKKFVLLADGGAQHSVELGWTGGYSRLAVGGEAGLEGAPVDDQSPEKESLAPQLEPDSKKMKISESQAASARAPKNEAEGASSCAVAKPGDTHADSGAQNAPESTEPPAVFMWGAGATQTQTETWKCGTCMLQWSMDLVKCKACESVKPGLSEAELAALEAKDKAEKEDTMAMFRSQASTTSSFGNLFAPEASASQSSGGSTVFGMSPSFGASAGTSFGFGATGPSPFGQTVKPVFGFGSSAGSSSTAASQSSGFGKTDGSPFGFSPAQPVFGFGAASLSSNTAVGAPKNGSAGASSSAVVKPGDSHAASGAQNALESAERPELAALEAKDKAEKEDTIAMFRSQASTTSSFGNLFAPQPSASQSSGGSTVFGMSPTFGASAGTSYGFGATGPSPFGRTDKPVFGFGSSAGSSSTAASQSSGFGKSDASPFGFSSAPPVFGFGAGGGLPVANFPSDSAVGAPKNEAEGASSCAVAKPGDTHADSGAQNAPESTEPPAVFMWGAGATQTQTETWKCGTCMLQWSMDLVKCKACESVKPGLSEAELAALEAKDKAEKEDTMAMFRSQASTTSSFGNLFAPEASASQSSGGSTVFGMSPSFGASAGTSFGFGATGPSPFGQTVKPVFGFGSSAGSSSTAASQSSGFGKTDGSPFGFSPAQPVFGFGAGDGLPVANFPSDSAVGAPKNEAAGASSSAVVKPGDSHAASGAQNAPESAEPPAVFMWGAGATQTQTETWKCGTCMLQWSMDLVKCKACESVKPGLSEAELAALEAKDKAEKEDTMAMFRSQASTTSSFGNLFAPEASASQSSGGSTVFGMSPSFGASAGTSFGFGATGPSPFGQTVKPVFGFGSSAGSSSTGASQISGFGKTEGSPFGFSSAPPVFGFGAASLGAPVGGGLPIANFGTSSAAAVQVATPATRKSLATQPDFTDTQRLPVGDVFVHGSGECDQLGLGDERRERKKPTIVEFPSKVTVDAPPEDLRRHRVLCACSMKPCGDEVVRKKALQSIVKNTCNSVEHPEQHQCRVL